MHTQMLWRELEGHFLSVRAFFLTCEFRTAIFSHPSRDIYEILEIVVDDFAQALIDCVYLKAFVHK